MFVRKSKDSKTRFTRKCIGEAIIDLMKNTSYEKLKVSQIVKRAGVARMTFYKYYRTPYEALIDYLSIVVSEYMEESGSVHTRDTFMKLDHIIYSLEYFDRYADFFLTLSRNHMYSIMMDGVNRYMERYISTDDKASVYQLYAYAGGLLNSFVKWEENGKKESASEVGETIYQLYVKSNEK